MNNKRKHKALPNRRKSAITMWELRKYPPMGAAVRIKCCNGAYNALMREVVTNECPPGGEDI